MPHQVSRNTDSNYMPIGGRRNGSLTFFFTDLVLEYCIYTLSPIHTKSNFWKKNTFVASYSRDLIA